MTDLVFDSAFLQRLERLSLVAKRTLRGIGRGDRRSKRHGGSVEFSDYRGYSWGDDVRRIDWHAFARFEALFLKLFVEEQDLAVHVLVDASPSMLAGRPQKLAYALRAAAALGYVALAAGDRLTLRPFVAGEARASLGPLRGRSRLARLLQFLEGVARDARPEGKTSLDSATKAFLARRPEPGVVLVVSDFMDPAGHERSIARLASAGLEPFLLQVASRDEIEPRLGEDLDLVDAETGETVTVALDRPAVRAYAERWGAFARGLEAVAKKHEIGHALAPTDVPFESLILELCRRGALAS